MISLPRKQMAVCSIWRRLRHRAKVASAD